MKITQLFRLFLIILALLIAESKPASNLKKVTKKSPESTNTQQPFVEKKKHSKEYYDKLVLRGLKIHNLTQGHPPYPFYKEMNFTEDKAKRIKYLKEFKQQEKKRRLDPGEQQTLNDLGFFGLIQDKTSKTSNKIMKFITNNIRKDDSRFILYPYPFEYMNKTNGRIPVNEGGVFTLDQTKLKGQTFKYIQNISSVQIGKAKGLYDIDIAILSIDYEINGMDSDLFYEASEFCNYFVTGISKISSCLAGKQNYLEYKKRNPSKGAVVRVSGTDINDDILFDSVTNQLKFKLLIIPDYLTNNEETIFNENNLNSDVVAKIQKFRNLGGNIITSGKSGYLLELMNMISSGTYDKDFVLRTKDSETDIIGCENFYKETPNEQTDFFKQLLCVGYKDKVPLSQAFKVKAIPSGFEPLIQYINKNKGLYYLKDSRPVDITNPEETFHYLLVSGEDGKKGRIFLVNGNPINNIDYFENMRNIILYTMTRDFIYDLKIKFSLQNADEDEDLPIPAGEEGVQLSVNYKFYNLFNIPMNNYKLEILFVNKIKIIQAPSDCQIKLEETTKFEELKDLNHSQYLLCEASSINKLTSIVGEFKIEITDYQVTQRLYDIPLMHSSFSFKIGSGDNIETIEVTPGIFYGQAAVAAVLRGTLNKDPTSAYPMKGKGLYFDLVLNVENKENTLAKDVNYIAQIPLVTPLVDGEDEGLIAQVVPVYEDYYFKHNFTYPWVDIEERPRDYIDYAEVAGKNICYVDDFDTPVKLSKNQRTDEGIEYPNKFELPNDTKIEMDEKMGSSKGISPYTLLRQLYFVDAERFYETAHSRQSLFVNTATEEGAKAYYGNDVIPENERDGDNEKIAKVQCAFIRVDTYFYTSIFNQYQLPSGIDGNVLISIDKFNQSNAPIIDAQLGFIRTELQNPGHYNSSLGKYKTLKPNEYRNPFRQYKNMKQYDPTDPDDLGELQTLTNGSVKLSHFMSPNKHPLIKNAGNIYGFKKEGDHGHGYLEQYPSVKFVYAHSIPLVLAPEITRLGGYVEIKLLNGVRFLEDNPIEKDRITTSADNVAFYKYEYNKDTGIVKLYFRRGLMPNENYGLPSKCEAYFEELNSYANTTVELNIYELKHDFSQVSLESYYKIESAHKEITAEYKSFFSFPCLHLENRLSRKNPYKDEPNKDMYEFELMNPFARYGGFFQELTKHTTVFGSGEAHHRTDPGFQGISGGFSIISNIGTSSIPFAEFLNHGTLAIPGVTSTSRLEWTDIWGRKWAQNLRSVYPDIPPIPPSPLNYIMTTTFELLTNTEDPKDQKRVIEWSSDESVYIWVQMKMRNTYKLYWEPTLCLENQLPHMKKGNSDNRNPEYILNDTITKSPDIGDEYDINLGFSSVYGVCYDDKSYMNGTAITPGILSGIKYMMSCAETLDPVNLTKCSKESVKQGLPIVKRRPDTINDSLDNTPDDNWNYSPLIEKYLPDGYINTNQMWQLTIEDYSDDQFWKGYPWHLDDCIPNLDNSIIKPHDIIAFPIYKGIGYNLTYSQNYSVYKFRQYKGWWSDQLQNKDHSLLAGQQRVSQVSVNHESLLKDSDWISAFDLKQEDENAKQNIILSRLKNFYVCQFNRHRVKIKPGQSKYSFLKNVYQNNVVPIPPRLQENDKNYTAFECKPEDPQYDIYNISQVDNRVYTGNDRDWLYFAAGLRGNAMEDINVILKLDPLESTQFEGITKVQDGGRFTYWQPPDGPNSYQYYDGNVNTVISKRVDLTIVGKAIPGTINTFNAYLYELFEIEDPKELNRTYTMTTYMNSHGYGDATTTVYVGGVDATSCRVERGQHTYVKIVFYNNAGFDWKMKEGAITLNDTAYRVFLNAMNIMKGKVTAVQYPSEYKFMNYEIPDEIKDYVTLTPSQHVMDVSPQFFDLTFNNILTIKDALEGDYFYCLNVSENFPKHLEGKLWEIKLKLNESWFYTLPSLNDPTNGFHDYHLTIPSIRFGVPISEGENKGKIFYNLGQAKNMIYTFKLYNEFEIKGIKIVNDEIINELGVATGDKKERYSKLDNIWKKVPENKTITNKIKITSVADKDAFYNLITVDLTNAFPLLPFEVAPNLPYQNKISLLIQSYSIHSPYGNKYLVSSTNLSYSDGRKIKTYAANPSKINVYSEGPHFSPSFEHNVAEMNESTLKYQVTKNQEIYEGDSILIMLTLDAYNEGNAIAYNPKFNIRVSKDAEYIKSNQTISSLTITEAGIDGDEKILNLFYRGQIEAFGTVKFDLVFRMKFGERNTGRRRILEDATNEVSIVKKVDISLCLSDVLCKEGDSNYGAQKTDVTHDISYKRNIVREVGKIELKAENIGTDTQPKYVLNASISDIDDNYANKKFEYIFYRKIEGVNEDYIPIKRGSESSMVDEPFADSALKEIKRYKVTYKVIGQYEDGRTLDSMAEDLNVFKDYYEEKDEEKKGGLPAYAIAIIVIIGAAIIAGASFLTYKLFEKNGVEAISMGTSENPDIIKKFDGALEKVQQSTTSPRKKRSIKNRSVITINNNVEQ